MKRSKNGSTPRQYAYAHATIGGAHRSKKERALAAGFSVSVAENAKHAIEETSGYNNAMAQLASETGNVVMQVYHVLKSRLKDEEEIKKVEFGSLLEAVSVISKAWETFTPKQAIDTKANPLKAIFLQPVQTVEANATEVQENTTSTTPSE